MRDRVGEHTSCANEADEEDDVEDEGGEMWDFERVFAVFVGGVEANYGQCHVGCCEDGLGRFSGVYRRGKWEGDEQ